LVSVQLGATLCTIGVGFTSPAQSVFLPQIPRRVASHSISRWGKIQSLLGSVAGAAGPIDKI
jgi:hypothetical protein